VYDVEALRQTSAALVEIGDSERRRIERNLHDGAQQRLVAAGMSLRLAAVRDPALEVTPLLAELSTIIERVRTVAHGIHPAILASAGLGAAIQELADNDDEPRVHLDLGKELGRLPDAVEITIYALVRSAISHAGNRDLEVTISARADTVITEAFPVKSDGAAARDFEALKDRARALAGELILIRDDGATVCRWRLTVPRRHPPPQAGTPDAKSAARTFVS
jgi:signal transduction histidine kinase